VLEQLNKTADPKKYRVTNILFVDNQIALSMGGAFGFYEGLRSSPSPAFKIRLNTVLNGMTRRGPFIGNSAGVMGKNLFSTFFLLQA
jgi:hypothetical protein